MSKYFSTTWTFPQVSKFQSDLNFSELCWSRKPVSVTTNVVGLRTASEAGSSGPKSSAKMVRRSNDVRHNITEMGFNLNWEDFIIKSKTEEHLNQNCYSCVKNLKNTLKLSTVLPSCMFKSVVCCLLNSENLGLNRKFDILATYADKMIKIPIVGWPHF